MAKGFVNHSDEFRKLLFQQSERYNIPFTHLCRYANISYKRFLEEYANVDIQSKHYKSTLTDDQLIKMGHALGLEVRFLIIVKDKAKFEETIAEVKKKLKDDYVNRKEEDNITGAE